MFISKKKIDEYKNKIDELERKQRSLEYENYNQKMQIQKLEQEIEFKDETLAQINKEKQAGCDRGEYCDACVYGQGYKVFRYSNRWDEERRTIRVCTYDTCKNFTPYKDNE